MHKTWRRGTTLMTSKTRKWSKKEIEENDKVEKIMILSDFYDEDQGRSRQKVCILNVNHPDYEANAKLIAAAPELLQACIDLCSKTGQNWEDAYKKAKAAIKKATT